MSFKPHVMLHKKLCDNFPSCPAMSKCKSLAISYKEDPEPNISVDINKCTACGDCITYCGLFRVALSSAQKDEIEDEFNNDPRNHFTLSADRFSTDFVGKANRISSLSEIHEFLAAANDDYVIIEFVDKKTVICPFQAIEVDIVLRELKLYSYRKFSIDNSIDAEVILNKYNLNQLPAILVFLNKKAIGTPIEGEWRIIEENNRHDMEKQLIDELKQRIIIEDKQCLV